MVTTTPEQVRRDAEEYFKSPDVPDSLSFVTRLSPLHQRLFARDLWDVTARVALTPTVSTLNELVDLVEAWEATAELDADPERLAQIRAPKTYRPLVDQ